MNPPVPPTGKPNLWAVSPLFVFLLVYLGSSLLAGDFYAVPITVAFLISSIYALAVTKGLPLAERIERFSIGASHRNILLMIWIFILAGAFAGSAESMGAIDATVNLTLRLLPDRLLFTGIFLASCFVSLAVGTSVGTIVALVPVAVGLADKTGTGIPFMTAIVVGGAFFGDNLSFISDTTIAATRTMGVEMRDKFRVNSLIVVPAAVLVAAAYTSIGTAVQVPPAVQPVEWIKVLPYLLVLVAALAGMNVTAVLVMGIGITGILGLLTGAFTLHGWFGTMGGGITGMGELIIVTLLAAGMLELIRFNGGMDYLIRKLTSHVRGKRGAELTIAALIGLANVCTANNTIAILTVGPIAEDIAGKFGLDRRKAASLLDTFSCFVQGLLPYGAQLLIASGLASISPVSIIPYLYYPFIMGIFAFLAILFRYPRQYSK